MVEIQGIRVPNLVWALLLVGVTLVVQFNFPDQWWVTLIVIPAVTVLLKSLGYAELLNQFNKTPVITDESATPTMRSAQRPNGYGGRKPGYWRHILTG